MFVGEDEIEGVIEEVVYENADTGYTVMLVDAGELITAVGSLPAVFEGEQIHAYGKWITHATYGRQFVCEEVEKNFPEGTAGILKFLASGAIKGVGKVTAQRIVETFGNDTFDILENEPLRLTAVRGISADKALDIGDQFRLTVGMRDVLMYLSEYNISPSAAVKIYKAYGSLTQRIVEADPYRLWEEIDGFSFQKADEVARRLSLPSQCEARVFAHIKYVLRHNLSNGHTFLPRDTLCRLAANLLDSDEESILIAIENMCERKLLCTVVIRDIEAVYLFEYYKAESYIAQRLAGMMAFPALHISDIDQKIDELEHDLSIQYADKQRKAIRGAIEHNVMLLTGGPGTGKTTALRGIIRLLEQLKIKFELCAPTGRAAKRMTELCDRPAQTIHRLLEVDLGKRDSFQKNEQNPILTDAVVVDETSMVDVRLFEALLRALRAGTKLILVGDADQLPSVGAGNVFRDILNSKRIFTIELDEIFRQARRSRIVVSAHQINHGEMPRLENGDDFFFVSKSGNDAIAAAVLKLATERIPNRYGQDLFHGVQIISPTKKTAAGTVSLNDSVRRKLGMTEALPHCTQGGRMFCVGDKVMQTRNNYDIVFSRPDGSEETGIFNGDIGIIEEISPLNKMLYIRFEDRRAEYPFENLEELDFAYAVTAHKSQGSEFDIVVLSLAEGTPMLQYRNLLYTAVTRAKKMLIIVGGAAVVKAMVDNNKQAHRFSGLRYLLEGQN